MSMINSVFVIGRQIGLGMISIPPSEFDKFLNWLPSSYGENNPGYHIKDYLTANGQIQRWVVLKEYSGEYNLHKFQGSPVSFDEIDNFIRTLQENRIANYDEPIQMRIITLA